MILKVLKNKAVIYTETPIIEDPDNIKADSWAVFGGLARVDYSQAPTPFGDVATSVGDALIAEPNDGIPADALVFVAECELLSDGRVFRVVYDSGVAFLLNDNGDTIEKI